MNSIEYALSDLVFERTYADDLSFRGLKSVTGKHRIHPYPAMMHPLVVSALLERFAKKGDVVFDPFCGSGSVLLVSGEHQYPSCGYDINPLGLLIALAKTTNYDKQLLLQEFRDVERRVQLTCDTDIPILGNPRFWYSDSAVEELGRIRYVLCEMNLQYLLFFGVFHIRSSTEFLHKKARI